MKKLVSVLILSLALNSHSQAAAPGVSGTLSIVPGLGQVANGNPLEGLTWFLTSMGLFLSGNSDLSQVGFDLWQYNMYDAYRDAGARSTTKYNIAENYIGAFNPINLVDPIGAPIVGYGAALSARGGYPALRSPKKVAIYGFVGLGEEGLFRGFLFPGFSDLTGSKWVGAILSSAVFSAAHVTGGASHLSASPLLQRFVLGMLFSWQTNRNNFDLRNSIFAHAWYDIFVDNGAEVHLLKLKIPF